jgi:hypothetical protein
MKSSEVKIDSELNERLWNRGITKPPRRITVKMEKDEDGVVTISIPKEEKPAEVLEEKIDEAALPENKEEALPPAAEEKKEEPSKAEKPSESAKKAPAKKKASARKPAAKKKEST